MIEHRVEIADLHEHLFRITLRVPEPAAHFDRSTLQDDLCRGFRRSAPC